MTHLGQTPSSRRFYPHGSRPEITDWTESEETWRGRRLELGHASASEVTDSTPKTRSNVLVIIYAVLCGIY